METKETEVIIMPQKQSKPKTEFKFIDLFAGIGGFHVAMHDYGGECVFASEIDKFARQTYEHNFSKISPELFEQGNFNWDITDPELDYKDGIPDFDVMCAGFPCQPFSQAGLKKGFADTRGTLFFNIEEIVRQKLSKKKKSHPKVLLLENVKGLRNHDKGRTMKVIEGNLRALGFNVKYEVLNSKNFGVPQNRERIFIVAWNKDLVKLNEDEFKFPYGRTNEGALIYDKETLENLKAKTKLGKILLNDSDVDEKYTISERLWAGHQRRKREHKSKGFGFGYSMFDSDSVYTSTISARYYKDGSEILINQDHLGLRPRKLHPREAARLQGFPIDKWFEIPVSDNQAYKQFGNSVSVPVIKGLAEAITNQLLK